VAIKLQWNFVWGFGFRCGGAVHPISQQAHLQRYDFRSGSGVPLPVLRLILAGPEPSLTYVEGRLRTREFEGKNAGGKRQRTEVVAQRVQFLGPRPEVPAGGEAEEPAASEEVPFWVRKWGPRPPGAGLGNTPTMTETERKKRGEKQPWSWSGWCACSFARWVAERFDLGIRRDAGEMILREGQGAFEIEATINWLGHENAKGAHIYKGSVYDVSELCQS
jgi:hypothetical protein